MSKTMLAFRKLGKKYKIVITVVALCALLSGVVHEALNNREVPTKETFTRAHFITTQEHTYDKRLFLHDYVTRKSYEVAHIDGRYDKWEWDAEGDVYTFTNPVVLGKHSVAYYVSAEKKRETGKIGQPLNMEGSINITNLKTGKTKQILRNHAGDLPQSVCCSVSPDGARLAIPQINGKIAIYNEEGDKINEVVTDAKIVPELGERDKKNDYDLASLSQGYPLVRWISEDKILFATGVPVRYNASHNDSINTNSLAIIDLKTGQQTPVPSTNGRSITWFDIWNGTIVFASHDKGPPGYGDGPLPGNLRLFTSALIGNHAQEIKDIPLNSQTRINEPGALFLDRNNGTIYNQGNTKSGLSGNSIDTDKTVLTISLKDGSRKSYKDVTFDIKGLLDSNTLVSEDSLINSSVGYTKKGYVYNLTTGKTEKIY